MQANKHINLLGYKCKDKVTGYKGIITSISFDLYGCVLGLVNPGLDKDGKNRDSHWFDVARLTITSKNPVMDVPNFESGYVAEGKKGPSEKPINNKM